MDRRAFMGTLTGRLLVPPLAARAQQAAHIPRVGVVADPPDVPPGNDGKSKLA